MFTLIRHTISYNFDDRVLDNLHTILIREIHAERNLINIYNTNTVKYRMVALHFI